MSQVEKDLSSSVDIKVVAKMWNGV